MSNTHALKGSAKKQAIKQLNYWKHSPHFAAEAVACLHEYDVLHILWQITKREGRDHRELPVLHGPARPHRLADN